MLVVIPTRIIPGVILAALFCFVGIGTGFGAATAFVHSAHFRWPHLICMPLFALAVLYIRGAWRGESEAEAVGEAVALSPKIMAVMFSLCLLVGLGTGIMIVYAIG